MTDVHKNSKKAAAKILAALDVLSFSPAIAAQVLHSAPGPVQHRLWLTVKALIHLWAIDAKYRQYEEEYQQIYDWAERVEGNGKGDASGG
jgi:hypothetical protein